MHIDIYHIVVKTHDTQRKNHGILCGSMFIKGNSKPSPEHWNSPALGAAAPAEVRTFQEALLLSPGNSQINGDLMVRLRLQGWHHLAMGEGHNTSGWSFLGLLAYRGDP